MFIGHAQHHACGIDVVAHQLQVVRLDMQLAVVVVARQGLRDDFRAVDVAIDAQVAPILQVLAGYVRDEGRMRQVPIVLAVGFVTSAFRSSFT